MDRFDLTLNAAQVKVRVSTLSIAETINGRNSLTADVLSLNPGVPVRPTSGDEALVDDDVAAELAFGGNVTSATEQSIDEQYIYEFLTRIQCVDFNAIADRRSVIDGGFPEGYTLEQAINSLAGYLTSYGVTVDPAQATGPPLPLMAYDVKKVSEWFNELSIVTGWIWEIDYNRVLRFVEPGTVHAPYDITEGDDNLIGDVQVQPSDTEYGNRVVLLAGTGQKDVTVDLDFDGVEDTFALPYTLIVASRGLVTVNGVDETIGAGATWEYDAGTNSITRTAGAPAAGTGSIVYTAQFPYRAIAENVLAQSGPRGIVERIVIRTDLFLAGFADALAGGYLLRYLAAPRVIRFATLTPGLHAGMTIQVTCLRRNLSAVQALITDMRAREFEGEQMRYDITAVEGNIYPGSWRDFYKQWSGGAAAASGVTGSVVVATGGTYLSAPSSLGGSDITWRACDTPARVPNAQPYDAPAALGVTVQGLVSSRAAQNVTVHLWDGTANASAGSVTKVGVGQAPVEFDFSVALVSGHRYWLYVEAGTAGIAATASGQVVSA